MEAAPSPLDATMRHAREIILGADDRINESIKWKRPTFAFKGDIAMRFAGLDELEAGRTDVEAAIRAWCDWKAG